MAEPARITGDALDDDVRAVLTMCGGDAIAALRITLIANAFLKVGGERLKAEASSGFSRGRARKAPRKSASQRKDT